MIEKHYTINELCKPLNMSFERVRQLVRNEPGVLKIEPTTPAKPSRSGHLTGEWSKSAQQGPQQSEGSQTAEVGRVSVLVAFLIPAEH